MSDSVVASFDRQYAAIRSSGGMVELTNWSSINVTGDDRQTFLHNFCTNDVKRLTPGTSCEAFVTNVKGRMVGHGLIACRDDALVIIGVPDQAPRLIEHLDRYVIREDVQLRDTTRERSYVLIAGGDPARKAVAEWAPAVADPRPDDRFVHVAANIAGAPVRCLTWRLAGSDFECLMETSPQDQSKLFGRLAEYGFIPCEPSSFTTARIEAGVPLFGIDFDQQNFPQEVGRDKEAISFTKGCYLGQETVARIDALGHVNQRIVGVRFTGNDVPPAGTELSQAGANVGRVTSAAFSPQRGAPLALAMVRREAIAPGGRLESPYGECEVVALPVVGAERT